MSSESTGVFVENLSQEDLFTVVEIDEIRVDPEVLETAKNGDLESQFKIAEIYKNERFFHHAKVWCLLLSEKNYAPAQFMIGEIYGESLLGYMDDDNENAEKWFEKAYKNDPKNIPLQVGLYYYNKGDFEKKTFDWFMKGATAGDKVAQYWVAEFYNHFDSRPYDSDYMYEIEMDKTKAIEWYQKSADQGYQKAIDKVKVLNKEGYYSMSKIKEKRELSTNASVKRKRANPPRNKSS